MKPIRTIGIVNDGGDAPGLNPVTRAIVRVSINEHRMRVVDHSSLCMDNPADWELMP